MKKQTIQQNPIGEEKFAATVATALRPLKASVEGHASLKSHWNIQGKLTLKS